ncbi:magnesium transporter [Thalassorhabdus alkalitolerans]|uniref:Magnesium transporter MgtE n=1 Tax=Thalassorhabdus alkalitolerans TaxID=2282697 RepID=A0ABW0YMI9_9BACI
MKKLDSRSRQEYAEHVIDLLQKEDEAQFRDQFLELHPTDQLSIFHTLNQTERKRLYAYLQPQEFAEIFQGMEFLEQEWVSRELNDNYIADMLNDMYSDDVADFLGELPEEKRSSILTAMDKEEAADAKELLSYPEETAGAIMTKEFLAVKADNRVSDVIEFLRKEGPDAETVYYLYVTNQEDQLVGVVSLRDLIVSPTEEKVENIMGTRVVSTKVTTDQEEVASLIQRYDLLAAPVVTDDGALVGIVTVDDVIDIIEEEVTEDIGEISATRGATDVNLSAFQAAKKRAPWIILLMFFGMITAGVIDQFEGTLEEIVILAAFIPLIMDSAGNTGTQSLAVVVRSLATGSFEKKGLWQTIRREFSTGVLIGLSCAIVLVGLITILYGNLVLAGVVAVSIFLSLSIATVTGALFPLIINKLKLDPAIASGPFVTTVNDILGLLIYFTIATSLLMYL